ncbi:hypothetical protein A2U01_0058240, partial [Trifolium medium]|nr:hypothetical protein [Trifolium medium]
MAITKKGEKVLDAKFHTNSLFAKIETGRRSPAWSFHKLKFHKDNFLDTESFACSRESRE